jgi:hypothetical protein
VIDTGPQRGPLTWNDARDFYTALNEAIDWRNIPDKGGKMRGAVMKIRSALDDQLRAVAKENGLDDMYDKALDDYHRAANLQRIGYGVGKIAGRIVGYQSPFHPWAAGSVGAQVGGPVVGGMVRSVLERPSGPPSQAAPTSAAPPATPPVAPRVTPEEYTRILLRAKEGEMTPGKADTLIRRLGGKTEVKRQPPTPPIGEGSF